MKKFIATIAAGAMIFTAGQALAFFEDYKLIRSIYTSAGAVEVGSDLGDFSPTTALTPWEVTWPGQPYPAGTSTGVRIPPALYVGDLIPLSTFDGSLSTLYVAYWGHGMADQDFYATGLLTTPYSGTDNDGMTMLGRKQSTADSIFNDVQRYYSLSSSIATSTVDRNNSASYYKKFDSSVNGSGRMGNNLKNDSFEMTLSLADLLSRGYVDQLLYWFDYNDSNSNVNANPVAVIRTFLTTDGRTIDLAGDKLATVINPSAVPIPAAGWLLGSGLLALIGIRRRNG